MPLHKSHLVDKLPWWAAALIALGYMISFAVCVGVGAAGPGPANFFPDAVDAGASSLACGNPLLCSVSASISMSGLSGYSQALWVVMSMSRPQDISTGNAVLSGPSTAFSVPADFSVTAVGSNALADGSSAALAVNQTNSAMLYCPPCTSAGAAPVCNACSAALVFAQPFLYYADYTVRVTVSNPWAGFVVAGVAPANINTSIPVGLRFNTGTVNPAFTRCASASRRRAARSLSRAPPSTLSPPRLPRARAASKSTPSTPSSACP